MWGFDGWSYSEGPKPYAFRDGERVRVTLVNDTMMTHPIHLHGHFFELVQGQAGHMPRKHTVNVPPGGKVAFDFTPVAGDWAFHCHMFYHMHAGMFQVFAVRPAAEAHDGPAVPAVLLLLSAGGRRPPRRSMAATPRRPRLRLRRRTRRPGRRPARRARPRDRRAAAADRPCRRPDLRSGGDGARPGRPQVRARRRPGLPGDGHPLGIPLPRRRLSVERPGWFGGDLNRFVLKSEGEGDRRGLDSGEVQGLYSRAVGRYTRPSARRAAGLRAGRGPHLCDPRPAGPVAPVVRDRGAVFLSDRARPWRGSRASTTSGSPRGWSPSPRRDQPFGPGRGGDALTGSGLSDGEFGLRLRYEISPEFAPYVGVSYERRFGRTADFARAAGEDVGGPSVVAGLRAWF